MRKILLWMLFTSFFACYIVFIYYLVNIAVYHYTGVTLSWQENIKVITPSILLGGLIASFCFYSYIGLNNNKFSSGSNIRLVILISLVAWFISSMNLAMKDINAGNNLREWYEYVAEDFVKFIIRTLSLYLLFQYWGRMRNGKKTCNIKK